MPCRPPGDLPNPGNEPIFSVSPALLVDSLLLSHQGSPSDTHRTSYYYFLMNFILIVHIHPFKFKYLKRYEILHKILLKCYSILKPTTTKKKKKVANEIKRTCRKKQQILRTVLTSKSVIDILNSFLFYLSY